MVQVLFGYPHRARLTAKPISAECASDYPSLYGALVHLEPLRYLLRREKFVLHSLHSSRLSLEVLCRVRRDKRYYTPLFLDILVYTLYHDDIQRREGTQMAPQVVRHLEARPTERGLTVDERRISPAGDPFTAAEQDRPCCCNDGWVAIGQEVVDPEAGEETIEYALYLCRRCNEVEGAGGYLL
jgi:hypothetical protein